ncbi:cytochrome c oxidase subunit II [Hamadaea sp.]|uniref:aa3-type cytochrome oxidase subunit II n=1 Tax=Hamadaea sp. TaxID=2024425 RepID=UPI0025B942AE|nr:cytochrome c oxidase subunit II [Hamadaea sp.]
MSALAVGALAFLSGCDAYDVGKPFGGFGWPDKTPTPQSQQMYEMWIWSVVAAFFVGFFVWGLIFWCIIVYRKRKGDTELPVQTRFNLPIEVLYSVLPFLVIAVLFYYTAVIQTNVNKLSPNPDVTVEVVAFKWEWQFNYKSAPDTDSSAATIATTTGASDYVPVLVVPTGKTIRIEETSKDVIHSFWVPDLLFKRDVFPGNVRNVFEVTIDEPGSYVGRCAELCGTYHSMMNFEVRAVSPEDYQKFLDAKKAGKTTPEALTAIGSDPYSTTTSPFNMKKDAQQVPVSTGN